MGCISEPVPSNSDPNMIYPVIPFLFYFLSPTLLVFQVATSDKVSSPNLCVNFLSPDELHVQPVILFLLLLFWQLALILMWFCTIHTVFRNLNWNVPAELLHVQEYMKLGSIIFLSSRILEDFSVHFERMSLRQ